MSDGEAVQVSDLSGPAEADPEQTDLEVCALEGCEQALPSRALDEFGRAKGGRRPRYCSKPHADAASRQRRARELESVADPLELARVAGEAFLPDARRLAGRLTELIARFDQAESGALARVRAAEHEAGEASAAAIAAREAAEAAEQARRQALAQARQDRQARDDAMIAAERSRQEAEQIRTGAWEQVVTHERARGQAEAARAAAESAAEAGAARHRELREQLDQVRAENRAGAAEQAASARELERSRSENRELAARIVTGEQLRAQQAEFERQRAETAEQALLTARADLADGRDRLALSGQEAEQLRHDLAALREQATGRQAELTAELEAERSARRLDQLELARVRQELSATARRGQKRRTAARAGDREPRPGG